MHQNISTSRSRRKKLYSSQDELQVQQWLVQLQQDKQDLIILSSLVNSHVKLKLGKHGANSWHCTRVTPIVKRRRSFIKALVQGTGQPLCVIKIMCEEARFTIYYLNPTELILSVKGFLLLTFEALGDARLLVKWLCTETLPLISLMLFRHLGYVSFTRSILRGLGLIIEWFWQFWMAKPNRNFRFWQFENRMLWKPIQTEPISNRLVRFQFDTKSFLKKNCFLIKLKLFYNRKLTLYIYKCLRF